MYCVERKRKKETAKRGEMANGLLTSVQKQQSLHFVQLNKINNQHYP